MKAADQRVAQGRAGQAGIIAHGNVPGVHHGDKGTSHNIRNVFVQGFGVGAANIIGFETGKEHDGESFIIIMCVKKRSVNQYQEHVDRRFRHIALERLPVHQFSDKS